MMGQTSYVVTVAGLVYVALISRELMHSTESLNNGYIGTDHFVHYREVVLFQR